MSRRVSPSPEPKLRRRRQIPPAEPAWRLLGRRALRWALALVALLVMIDALFGNRGLLETIRARREYAEVAASLDHLKDENARLREEARRLREDPTAIEAEARRDLGMIRPGEVLFIVKDAHPRPR